jgi:transcriptional regulator with XRE-family HTH domain
VRFDVRLTDSAILEELGTRLGRLRINANFTQAQLAEEAAVSKRTVERIEAGNGTDFVLLIRVLRTLKLIDGMESLIPDLPLSPIALWRLRGRERRRVGHPRRKGGVSAPSKSPGPWTWGE